MFYIQPKMEDLKVHNESFAKLLTLLENGKLEKGTLQSTARDLNQVSTLGLEFSEFKGS